MGSMAIFGKIGGTFKGVVKACAAMEAMAVAICNKRTNMYPRR